MSFPKSALALATDDFLEQLYLHGLTDEEPVPWCDLQEDSDSKLQTTADLRLLLAILKRTIDEIDDILEDLEEEELQEEISKFKDGLPQEDKDGEINTEFDRNLQDAQSPDDADNDAFYAEQLQGEYAYGAPGTLDRFDETGLDFLEATDPLMTGREGKRSRKTRYPDANGDMIAGGKIVLEVDNLNGLGLTE